MQVAVIHCLFVCCFFLGGRVLFLLTSIFLWIFLASCVCLSVCLSVCLFFACPSVLLPTAYAYTCAYLFVCKLVCFYLGIYGTTRLFRNFLRMHILFSDILNIHNDEFLKGHSFLSKETNLNVSSMWQSKLCRNSTVHIVQDYTPYFSIN